MDCAGAAIPESRSQSMLRWYLIYTKPSSEALALKNLARQRYDAYVPRVLQTVRRAGGRHDPPHAPGDRTLA